MLRIFFIALFFFAGVSLPALAVAVDEEVLSDPVEEAAAREIMKDVRCLVCQNQSIEDSQADLAQDLRRIVRERVAIGETRRDIEAFLTARYGDWILLEPPLRPRTIALWLFPVMVLLLGGWLAFRALRARGQSAEPRPLNAKERAKLKQLLGEGDGT